MQASHTLSQAQWQSQYRAHYERVMPWTQGFRLRRCEQQKHPVHDFLFQYYSFSPAKLEQWHPGIGVAVASSDETSALYGQNKRYHQVNGYWTLNPAHLTQAFCERMERIITLLESMQARPASFSCFGLHEWAMVYRAEDIRHPYPLRMSEESLAEFVESQKILCSHYDAFRFFTEAARPLNQLQPRSDTRPTMEQCGCLHANMDLYKWAFFLFPWGGSTLIADAFALACSARELDMRASPYDLQALGYEPIRIETSEGREAYVRAQKAISERAEPLRTEVLKKAKIILRDAQQPITHTS